MKKYSSYKSIKPLNTTIGNMSRIPLSPTHSSSYRKLTTIQITNQKPSQKRQIYPLSAKNTNFLTYTTTNQNRKKMFSSKNQQSSFIRPLTLNRQDPQNNNVTQIRTKINDLENRLHQIKKNYQASNNARKINQRTSSRLKDNYQNTKDNHSINSHNNIKNKQNQVPKQKKTQSRLLLQRYQNNKKLQSNINSASTRNLNTVQHKYEQQTQIKYNHQIQNKFGMQMRKQSLSPLSPKLNAIEPLNPKLNGIESLSPKLTTIGPLSPKSTLSPLGSKNYTRNQQKPYSNINQNQNNHIDHNIPQYKNTQQKVQNTGLTKVNLKQSYISTQNNNIINHSSNNSNIGNDNSNNNTSNKYVRYNNNQMPHNKNISIANNNSNNNDQTYLKQFVTTFTIDNKLPLCHSTSQSNLYKPMNKLYKNQTANKNQYYISPILNAFESPASHQQTSFQNLCRQHMVSSLDILSYIKNSKKQPPMSYTCKSLPQVKDNKHTIIFDLDQTLIHCNQNLNIQHDVALPIKFPNGSILKAGINVRPYAKQCLKQLSKHFQLIVFTASHQCYGNVIVDYLDPKKQYISYRYFRDSCYKTQQGFYVKDLRVIDRDLKKVLLIDNAAYSYCFQLENGIPIIPFYDNKADLQLKNLIPYLKSFLNLKQVKTKNQSEFKLTQYGNFKDVKTLINKLYASQLNQ